MRSVKYYIVEERETEVEVYKMYNYREAKEKMQQMKRKNPGWDYRIEMR